MYYVYADGFSIYNQFDRSLTIHSPKVTLELGKAGSFQFDIPPTNQYYNSLTQLKTIIKVELDDKTIFYGRVFSITRNFNNIKHVYCEGALSYLIDTLQQAKSYKGKAKELFRNIIDAHNTLTDSGKKFTVDRLEIEDTDVIISGKKDKDGKYYGDEYEQTIIESIAEEWLTTYDYINNVLIEYLGGYLIYEYDGNRNKISYISEDSFDQMIEDASSKNLNVPTINYGVNMLDLTEELNAEDLCTVLIPIGDDGLTIEKATNKNQYSDVKIENIDGKGIAIAHRSSVERYGKIIKSYVFDNVNEADTLFTNGYKYLKSHKNIPISFTVKAVDMHFVNKDQDSISVGEIAKIDSTPHNLVEYLICTKVEYELEDASKNQYTFGNPKQSLTERYKKNKEKQKQRASRSSTKSSSKALSTASDIAQAYADAAVETVNKNYATIKNWVEDHYAGIEEAVHFVSTNGEGFVRSTKWVDEYGANTEEVLTWHGKYAESAVTTIKWANDYSAGIEDTVNWKTRNAEGLASTKKWVDDYSADIEQTVQWKSRSEKDVSSIASIRQKANANEASITSLTNWKNGAVDSLASVTQKANANEASITSLTNWKNGAVNSLASVTQKANANEASITLLTNWKKDAVESLASVTQKANANGASITLLTNWKKDAVESLASVTQKANANGASIDAISKWKSGADSSISGIQSTADAAKAMASLFATYNVSNKTASISLSANSQESLITILGDKIDARASAVFANELTANKIMTTAFNGGNYKVLINDTGMFMSTNLTQTANSSAYILATNIYRGTSINADNAVQTKAMVDTAITNATSAAAIRNKLKGNYDTFGKYLAYVLGGDNINLGSDTKIYRDGAYRTFEYLVEKKIDAYLTATKLKTIIKNNNEKTWTDYLVDTIIDNIKTKNIECANLKVQYNGKAVNIINHISSKIRKHTHTYSATATINGSNDSIKRGAHYHSYTVNGTTYNTSTDKALASTWSVSVSGTTDGGS